MKLLNLILMAIIISNSFCNDLDLSAKAGSQTLETSQGKLYFHRIVKGLSTALIF